MTDSIEGRAFLYNFDFLKFRDRAEETISLVNVFHWQGICWRFRFKGQIKVYLNGHFLWALAVTDTDNNRANGHTLISPYRFVPDSSLCIEVIDFQPRWFRWFRPNTAHVTLEGIEEDPHAV